MKKIISVVLIALMLSAMAFTASANAISDDVSKMLSLVKSRISSTEGYDIFSNSTWTENGKKIYRFNWSSEKDDNYKGLRVSITDDGIITSYSVYGNDYDITDKPTINRPSTDEALIVAQEQLKKLNPDICDKLVVTKSTQSENIHNYEYHFDIQRFENNIPVLNNNGYINISSDATAVTSFDINYTPNLKFEASDKTIDYNKAAECFENNIGMKMHYVIKCDDKYKKSISCEYCPKYEHGKYIDAVTGEVFEYQNDDFRVFTENSLSSADKAATGLDSGFTKAEIKEIDTIDGLMDVNTLINEIRTNKIMDISKKYKLNNQILSKSYNSEKYTYNFEFDYTQDNDYSWISVSADAKTGEVLSFYKSTDYDSKKKITDNQALAAANEAVAVLAPSHFGEKGDGAFKLNDENSDGYYSYTRYVNGIPFEYNSINIAVNLSDGSIYRYSKQFDEFEFPSLDGAISATDACKGMLSQADYKLWYLPVYEKDLPKEAKLIYASDSVNMAVDAFSGKLVNIDDEKKVGPYDDIEGHYAEQAINTLSKYSVGFESNKFLPDSSITQKDFMALINFVFMDSYPIVIYDDLDCSSIYSNAKNLGILKESEYAPDSLVTRQMAAEIFVRAMGFEDVAKLDGIFVQKFADVSENKGYTSILSAMGILSGDEYGKFNPDAVLTRADTAVMIYNYLSK